MSLWWEPRLAVYADHPDRVMVRLVGVDRVATVPTALISGCQEALVRLASGHRLAIGGKSEIKMLDCVRQAEPRVLALLVHGEGGWWECRIGEATDCDAAAVRIFVGLPVDRGAALGTEVMSHPKPAIRLAAIDLGGSFVSRVRLMEIGS
jgi:hypothetical protein